METQYIIIHLFFKIYQKIYNKALKYEYIKDKEVIIYKDELDVILKIEDKKARDLLFVSLVYYKWGLRYPQPSALRRCGRCGLRTLDVT